MKRILEVKKQIGTLSKNKTNPFYHSQYLELNDLLTHIEPLLWEQGLMLVQPILDNKVCSIIMDESGKTLLESHIQLPPITDPQKLGSCITYFRRYTLKSLLAISEEDDDGNKTTKPVVKKEAPKLDNKPLALPPEIADILNCENREKVKAFVQKFKFTDEDKALITVHYNTLKDESKKA
jgi:hypothetical protein